MFIGVTFPLFGCSTSKYYSTWSSVCSFAANTDIRSLAIAAAVCFGFYSFVSIFNVLFNWVFQGFISNSSFDFNSSVYCVSSLISHCNSAGYKCWIARSIWFFPRSTLTALPISSHTDWSCSIMPILHFFSLRSYNYHISLCRLNIPFAFFYILIVFYITWRSTIDCDFDAEKYFF